MSTNKDQVRQMIKRDKKRLRLKRLAHHLGISMSLMADADVYGKLTEGSNVPAYTQSVNAMANKWSGKNSWWKSSYGFGKKFDTSFCADLLPNKDLKVWLGTAWHELGHVLWSPFDGQIPITIGLNLLEDARIETLILQKFPKTKGALMATLKHMFKDFGKNDPVFSYVWVAGRTHLSREIRTKLRSAVDPDIAFRIDEIYKDYLSMGTQLDFDTATHLAEALNKILGIVAAQDEHSPCGTTLMNVGKQGVDTDTQIPSNVIDDVGGDESDKLIDSVEGNMDALDKEMGDFIRGDSHLKEEASKLEEAVSSGQGHIAKTGMSQSTNPTPTAKELAQQVRRVAMHFNDESAKGLVRRRDMGRLRPHRYEVYGDIDTAYDQWEPGLEQEMHVSLLIDVSGSMRGAPIDEVSYALEVGLSDVASVDIAYFNGYYWTPHERNSATRMIHVKTSGGTDPTEGLAYFHSLIEHQPQMNKLLVMYTDGGFDGAFRAASVYLEDLHNSGVNIRIIGEAGNASSLDSFYKWVKDWMPRNHIIIANSLRDLPGIVLGWTKTVLTKGQVI